jgi:predicted nucleotide-binding protein
MMSTAPPLEGSTTASPWVPLWQIIERIASAIEDSRELEHYARTRLRIRQAALDGRLRIRGRHEIEIPGQDRTNFSDVYTEIPSDYWKHSVINVLATGAAFEADRHTDPEKTVYAWGPKGFNETNSYTGLQLNSDDVSQLIDDVKGTSFSSDAPMSEKEEWINAASAVALLGMKHLLGTRTICKRAHAGLIKARAERFIRDGRSADNVDVPAEFWWAEGGAALDQNWTSGDFDTWIDQRIHLQAFGVTFRRSDIERSKPAPLVVNAASPALTPARAFEERQKMTATGGNVFIGHGRSLVWRELRDFLEKRLHLTVDEFNSVPVAGVPTVIRLEEMLNAAAFAFLVMTAEDELPDGKLRARLNVVHEAGLFQGKLGFKKAIILLEEGCEDFSNIHGLNHIPFPKGDISAKFEKIREVLEREGLAASEPPGGKLPERKILEQIEGTARDLVTPSDLTPTTTESVQFKYDDANVATLTDEELETLEAMTIRPFLAGRPIFPKDVAEALEIHPERARSIMEKLESQGLLFAAHNYKHGTSWGVSSNGRAELVKRHLL